MAKKSRTKKTTVYGCIEGKRENVFLTCLTQIYQSKDNGINIQWEGATGGAPDKFISVAMKACDRDKSFAWLDEDFEPKYPLSRDARECLAKCWNIQLEHLNDFYSCPLRDLQKIHNPKNRKPLLIISNPVCVESIILKSLGEVLPFVNYDHTKRTAQIDGLKNKLNELIGDNLEADFYLSKLSIDLLEQRKILIPELDLLISLCKK